MVQVHSISQLPTPSNVTGGLLEGCWRLLEGSGVLAAWMAANNDALDVIEWPEWSDIPGHWRNRAEPLFAKVVSVCTVYHTRKVYTTHIFLYHSLSAVVLLLGNM